MEVATLGAIVGIAVLVVACVVIASVATSSKMERRAKAWKQFSDQFGADFNGVEIKARVKEWTITLSEEVQEEGPYWTIMSAPYLSKDGFEFMVYPRGTFSDLGKLFGAQQVEIGDPHVDGHFIIKANDESKVRALFVNRRVRRLTWPNMKLLRFEATPSKDKHSLYLRVEGSVYEVKEIESLFELFTETLNHLVEIGSASEEAPNVGL